jgi:hypothetical protein
MLNRGWIIVYIITGLPRTHCVFRMGYKSDDAIDREEVVISEVRSTDQSEVSERKKNYCVAFAVYIDDES